MTGSSDVQRAIFIVVYACSLFSCEWFFSSLCAGLPLVQRMTGDGGGGGGPTAIAAPFDYTISQCHHVFSVALV